jgi:hypothetical protein
MTELALRSMRSLQAFWLLRLLPNGGRFAVLLVVGLLLAASPELTELVTQTMAEAYLQVSVFVALTLTLFYAAEKSLKLDLGAVMARQVGWQPAIAALLGALPGCGGAIVVVTQYTRGYATFGALISVLVATMGDAAFLLLAQDPASFGIVLGVSLVAGTVSGMVVDRMHGRDFLRPERDDIAFASPVARHRLVPAGSRPVWFAMLVPGAILGAAIAFQMDPDELVGVEGFTRWLGFAGAALCLVLWSLSPGGSSALAGPDQDTGTRVMADTNFVTAWVVMAFLAYELSVFAFDVDIGVLFQGWAPFLPIVAILVGFIPGCGPQIVVTTLYLAGAIPLSAQLSNAISNDGDALFPAIALAPRAAILATLYSAVPALIVGYTWFALFE